MIYCLGLTNTYDCISKSHVDNFGMRNGFVNISSCLENRLKLQISVCSFLEIFF